MTEKSDCFLTLAELPCVNRDNDKGWSLSEKDAYLHIYRLAEVPKRLPDFNDYFVRALAENDSRYYVIFMHFYEPVLNSRVRRFCESRDLTV